jgi:hypothetical protein
MISDDPSVTTPNWMAPANRLYPDRPISNQNARHQHRNSTTAALVLPRTMNGFTGSWTHIQSFGARNFEIKVGDTADRAGYVIFSFCRTSWSMLYSDSGTKHSSSPRSEPAVAMPA